MLARQKRRTFEEAPSSFKSTVWGHFGFSVKYNDEGTKTVNKQSTVCHHCFATVGYSSGNTSDMVSETVSFTSPSHGHIHIPVGAWRVLSLANTQKYLAVALQQQFVPKKGTWTAQTQWNVLFQT